MAHVIEWVNPHGVAARRGIKAGDSLIAIHNEPILNEIVYQALSNKSRLDLSILRANGKEETIQILKAQEMPLGMQLADITLTNAIQVFIHENFYFNQPPGRNYPTFAFCIFFFLHC